MMWEEAAYQRPPAGVLKATRPPLAQDCRFCLCRLGEPVSLIRPDDWGKEKQVVITCHESSICPSSAHRGFGRPKAWGKMPELGPEYVAWNPDLLLCLCDLGHNTWSLWVSNSSSLKWLKCVLFWGIRRDDENESTRYILETLCKCQICIIVADANLLCQQFKGGRQPSNSFAFNPGSYCLEGCFQRKASSPPVTEDGKLFLELVV